MAPFEPPSVALHGFKERIDAISIQGDRVYLGTSTGNLYIYRTDDTFDGELTQVEVKKGLTRRAIEQIGYIKDINSLAVLSESQVTLYPLPDVSSPTILVKAKAAFSFAVHTTVLHLLPDGSPLTPSDAEFGSSKSVPTMVTYLVVGCRRKVVEATLPHSARTIAFLNHDIVCLAYPAEYVLFSLDTMSAFEISAPMTTSLSGSGITKGALSGLGGYMTLGLGSKGKPCAVAVRESEVLIAKDNTGVFIGINGKPSRDAQIDWPAPPEDVAVVKPYIFSILPAGTVPIAQDSVAHPQPSFIPSPVIQIRSSISLKLSSTLPFPFSSSPSHSAPAVNSSIRLLTPSPAAKSPLFVVTTPNDRTAAANEGSTVWKFTMKGWGEQVDELVEAEQYTEALSLLDTLDPAVLQDKDRRITLVRTLRAVHEFKTGNFDVAIDTFTELNINPAKVVALYPESIAGRLSVPQERWVPLFGGPAPKIAKETSTPSEHGDSSQEGAPSDETAEKAPTEEQPASEPSKPKAKSALDAIKQSGLKDPDSISISSVKRRPTDSFSRSVEALLRYLPDRRQKVAGALEAFHITPSQSHKHACLSETSVEDLFDTPSSSVSMLTPEQLVRYAQVVDTALFKSYLIIRPGLLGPLCRRPNWCEVSEVEEVLAGAEKFSELIALYNGQEMHAKALDLLRSLSDKETDMRDKLGPSISYLQRLGPEHLDQIFRSSRWVFEQEADMAFQIFTSEEVELPRQSVTNFLESVDPKISARYLEYLIEERNEGSYQFHDRLAELYLKMTIDSKKRHDEGRLKVLFNTNIVNVDVRIVLAEAQREAYAMLLNFIDTTHHYQVDRLFGILPTDDLYEARAILLGQLGRHDNALELYVYRLHDYAKAEEYCKRIYKAGSDTDRVFLTLLRIYLRPLVKTSENLLQPALELISRHGPRLDSEEALQLLPPLVTAQDVRDFLVEALRAPVFDTKVVRDVSKARNEQVARKLMYLQSNRVKVTDTRVCPQCHKRIGHSVIAVHTPGGEVTHYQCREAFAQKLKELRHI
ncbi:hypothetical protein EVG20_g6316 [Dentipellis fragilis]|uniref:CNH domain-containing protein n=1 Tax=Dentipellis fragilis TaxID=205917 RepID=A0A4Y9YLY3_9AGAM|nr:hypothetical protein EVG20_g6316 [Dentipellis fragilis]